MQREIVIVGVTHRSAPVEVREQVAFSDDRIENALRQLVQIDSIEEGVILSTCNRVEVVASTSSGDDAVEILGSFLAAGERSQPAQLTEHLSVYRGREAVRHLFRVAASLDSMVVGEPQILGQLKGFYTRASAVGSVGMVLHRCFHKAFSVAKRVRSETGVANKSVSVSSAAVDLASKIFERLEDKTAMLIGAGAMGESAARHLLAHGVRSMIVANRTFDRAVELARDLRATPVPFDELERYLALADVVIGSTAADEPILTMPLIRSVLRQRKYRPMFLIDLSVPRNFDPQINQLDNVYLYDIDDLGAVAHENLDERGREANKAEEIVDDEVDTFTRWLASLDAVPTIVALRDKFDAIRRAELDRTIAALRELSPGEREALEVMTQAIVNKILHAPIRHLKQHGRRREAMYLAAARQLFDIEDPEDP
jgi:glutamyl-tRNA reductase